MPVDPRRNPEIGRKLLAHDLKTRMVVVLYRPAGSTAVTAWVRGVGLRVVDFYMGATNTLLFLTALHDGTLADDTGKEVEVYEYLGKI